MAPLASVPNLAITHFLIPVLATLVLPFFGRSFHPALQLYLPISGNMAHSLNPSVLSLVNISPLPCTAASLSQTSGISSNLSLRPPLPSYRDHF